jgi:hypothetical protein
MPYSLYSYKYVYISHVINKRYMYFESLIIQQVEPNTCSNTTSVFTSLNTMGTYVLKNLHKYMNTLMSTDT